MVSVRAGTATDVGRIRQANEDSAFVGRNLFAVADGMGGHAAGDVASAIAMTRLARLAERQDLQSADIRAEVAECNRDILAAAAADQDRSGMGTTLAGIGLTRIAGTDHWVVFNVGDSRVYRFADGDLVQVTIDHSEVAQLVAAGAIDSHEARSHPKRNVITQVLGMRPEPAADVWVFPLTPGERFVICTDGLSGELTDAQIAAVLCAQPVAQPAAEALVGHAVAAGGRDNVTVVVVDHLIAVEDTLDENTLRRSRATEEAA